MPGKGLSGEEFVSMVSSSLPKIVPNVLINKREELTSLLVATHSVQSDEKQRSALVSALFNLIRNPEPSQRQAILAGCEALAARTGPTKTETELLPLCWEQMGDKHPGRRILVADACSLLAPHLPDSLLSSLVLSMLGQRLSEERDGSVRQSLLKALSVLLLFITDADKYQTVWELVQRSVVEEEEGGAAVTLLLPAFAIWADEVGRLQSDLSLHYLRKINHVLTSAGISQSGNETVLVKYLGCVEAVLPRVYWTVLRSGSYRDDNSAQLPNLHSRYPQTKGSGLPDMPLMKIQLDNPFFRAELLGADEDEVRRLTASFDALTANEWFESWPAFDFFYKSWLPELLKMVQLMEVKLCRALPVTMRLFRLLCCYFGPSFTTLKLRPIFETFMKECPKPGSAITPVYCVGVLSAQRSKENMAALRTFLRGQFLAASQDEAAALALSITFFELCGWWGEEGERGFLDLVWELVVRKEDAIRSLCAALVGRLTPRVSMPTLKNKLLPALLTLSSDHTRSVKVAAVLGFPRVIQVAGTEQDVMEKVCVQLASVLEENDPYVLVPLFRCLAQLSASFPARFRDDFLLAELGRLVALWRDGGSGGSNVAQGPPPSSEAVGAMFELLSALSCSFIPPHTLANTFIPALQALLPCLDAERQKIGVSIIREAKRKAGVDSGAGGMGAAGVGDLGVEEAAAKVLNRLRDIARVDPRSIFSK